MARTILTYDGMQGVPNDGLRRELLRGDLYVSPAPSPTHQRLVGQIYIALNDYAALHGGEAFVSPIDVVLSQTDAVQPDVVYVGPERHSIVGDKNIQGVPSLVVEVLSPSSSDVDPGPKLAAYARHGVPEYWIVDPYTATTIAYAEPVNGEYKRVTRSDGGIITAMTLSDLQFTLR